MHQHDQKKGRPYHRTIAIVFASRLLQIGDNQGPNAYDVGDNVHKMRHTQVIGQDGLFQSGARVHPITRLSTLQPIDDKFGHCQTVQAAEHTRSCAMQTPSKKAKIENWVVNQFLTVPIAQILAEGFHEDG